MTVPLSFESFEQDLDSCDTRIPCPSDRKQKNISYIELSDDQSEELENVTEQACALVDDFEKELDAMWHDVHQTLTCETEDRDLWDNEAFPDEGDFDFVDIVEELTFSHSNQWNYGSAGIEDQVTTLHRQHAPTIEITSPAKNSRYTQEQKE